MLDSHAQNSLQNSRQEQPSMPETELPEPEKTKKSNIKTKVFFGLFLFFVFFALIFSFLSFRSNIKIKSAYEERQVENEKAQQESWQELIKMQSLDTDGDGLTDYDEQYIYQTSIYLADTDSDGYDDNVEIKSGNNPLCPSGRDCEIDTETRAEISDFPEEPESYQDFDNYTPEEIRQMLIDGGASEIEVYALSDEQIIQIVEEVKQENPDSNITSPITAQGDVQSENMSVAEIRQALLDTGEVSTEQIDQISDSELLSIYQEVFQEINTNE
jgi:hypothetical protein